MNFSAVILAGGKSSRMGRDKALIETNGRTLLARQIELARETGAEEIFISGRADQKFPDYGVPVLVDRVSDAGPLAGIEQALEASTSPLVLVLAVDMPSMNASTLRHLLSCCSEKSGAIPRVAGQIEPLAAFYPKTGHGLSVELLKERFKGPKHFGERSVENGLAVFVDLDEENANHFKSWNRPEDRG